MVGSGPEHNLRSIVILRAFGSNIVLCGPIYCGIKFKILNNAIGLTNLFLTAEILRFAGACRIDERLLMSSVEAGAGRNFFSRNFDETIKTYGSYAGTASGEAGIAALSIKDMEMALHLAHSNDANAPILETLAASLRTYPRDLISDGWRDIATKGYSAPASGDEEP